MSGLADALAEQGITRLQKQGVDLFDAKAVVGEAQAPAVELLQEAREGLLHLRMCGTCAEDAWSSCEDGQGIEDFLTKLLELENGGRT